MNKSVLTLGILLIIIGVVVAFATSVQGLVWSSLRNEFEVVTIYPYWIVGGIICLIGVVAAAISFAFSEVSIVLKNSESGVRGENLVKVKEMVYTHINYVSGHPDYSGRNTVKMVLKNGNISFESLDDSAYKMALEIPIQPEMKLDYIMSGNNEQFIIGYKDSKNIMRLLKFEKGSEAVWEIRDLINEIEILKNEISKETQAMEITILNKYRLEKPNPEDELYSKIDNIVNSGKTREEAIEEIYKEEFDPTKKQENLVFCGNCGNSIFESEEFCVKCGTKKRLINE